MRISRFYRFFLFLLLVFYSSSLPAMSDSLAHFSSSSCDGSNHVYVTEYLSTDNKGNLDYTNHFSVSKARATLGEGTIILGNKEKTNLFKGGNPREIGLAIGKAYVGGKVAEKTLKGVAIVSKKVFKSLPPSVQEKITQEVHKGSSKISSGYQKVKLKCRNVWEWLTQKKGNTARLPAVKGREVVDQVARKEELLNLACNIAKDVQQNISVEPMNKSIGQKLHKLAQNQMELHRGQFSELLLEIPVVINRKVICRPDLVCQTTKMIVDYKFATLRKGQRLISRRQLRRFWHGYPDHEVHIINQYGVIAETHLPPIYPINPT